MKGKDYARKKSNHDNYNTPRPLTWELLKLGLFDYNRSVLEPACGQGAIVEELKQHFHKIHFGDIKNNFDFLDENCDFDKYDYIITNPPFSQFDGFVIKAKEIAKEKFAFIGKTNFFGAEKRNRIGIWKNLKYVYIFNRQVDYRYFREDNYMQAGNLITGWFIWDMNWKENYWMTSIIDVQKYMLKKG